MTTSDDSKGAFEWAIRESTRGGRKATQRGEAGLSSRKGRRALLGSLRSNLSSYRCDGQSLLFTVAHDLYRALDTPISLSCEILLRYGELEQLVRKDVDPSTYLDPFRFRDDRQAVAFLKKAPISIPHVSPTEASEKTFIEAEEKCCVTNTRIRSTMLCHLNDEHSAMGRVIRYAIAKIHDALGSFSASEWSGSCRFGPGSFNHTGIKGLTSLYDKMSVRPSVSHDMVGLGALLVMSQPHWAKAVVEDDTDGFWPFVKSEHLCLIPGNRVTHVPKTAVTERAIAIEPLLNVYAQLGIGRMVRRRLKRFGIDLDDQGRNQILSREGSIDGSLATIDLSSASDTVAKELVRALLPREWFEIMDLTRSKIGKVKGRWIRYEKFSSMGNGFTFELETLIFWGLALGVCHSLDIDPFRVSVYGDDIIVPVEAYDLMLETLDFCGFIPNRKKSFGSGLFRESCGKDWFNGVDVRPYFVKDVPHEIQDLFRLANGVRLLAYRRNSFNGCDARLHSTWTTVLRALPRSVAQCLRIPPFRERIHFGFADFVEYGTTEGLMCNWDEAQVSPFLLPHKGGWEGYSGLRYQPTPVQAPPENYYWGSIASRLFRLKQGRDRSSVDEVTRPASPRQGREFTYQLRDGAFLGPWTEFGPWREP